MKKEITPVGTLRIDKDLRVYEKTKSGWNISKNNLSEVISVVKLFKSNNNFHELIDKKNPKFLKGQLSPEGNPQGARINILPNGKKLDGAYSLFAKNLTFHDEITYSHWDLIYKNPNGKFAYHYTLDKKIKATSKKYHTVEEFEKKYHLLEKRVFNSLRDKKNYMALPVYTLLKTYMRIGNEIYYKTNNHKGLVTLKKSDIKIRNNIVNFNYIGKAGVPQSTTKKFPEVYIKRLKNEISIRKSDDFIFTKPNGKLLHENDFKRAFNEYIGKGFYPHIVRSYFATKQTRDFFKKNHNPDKKQIKDFLKLIAEELGHKKFSKKTGNWEDSYSVTISHYIEPKLVEKITKHLGKKH